SCPRNTGLAPLPSTSRVEIVPPVVSTTTCFIPLPPRLYSSRWMILAEARESPTGVELGHGDHALFRLTHPALRGSPPAHRSRSRSSSPPAGTSPKTPWT